MGRVLYAHQKRCEVEGRYSDAQQAKDKIEQIKVKEIERHQNNVKTYQEQELMHVENAQKQQFIEFTKTWDEYMREFDLAAQDSLNRLRVIFPFQALNFRKNMKRSSMKAERPY